MMQEQFARLRAFSFAEATVNLWMFKLSSTPSKFRASHVQTDQDLDGKLKAFAIKCCEELVEQQPYGHLAQAGDGICLSTKAEETDFELLKVLVNQPEHEHLIKKLDELRGVAGYVAKFTYEGKTVYATRRAPGGWRVKKKASGINLSFKEGKLSAVSDEQFLLLPNFDLFGFEDALFIADKRAFESLLKYRDGYVKAFGKLQTQENFSSLFTSVAPLVDFVGAHALHLRRMAVVQERNLFANPKYLAAVQKVCFKRNIPIKFNAAGLIEPDAKTAPYVLTVLLDHFLVSEITDIMYEVNQSNQFA